MKIKRKSWHYFLVNFGNQRVYAGQKTDFCTYFWYVVFGLFHLIGLVLGIIIFTLLIAGSFYDYYNWLMHNIPMHDVSIAVVIITFIIIASIAIGYCVFKYTDWKDSLKKSDDFEVVVKEPGFFTLAYRKWKEKTCILVEIEKQND
jgi:hypothetical protein